MSTKLYGMSVRSLVVVIVARDHCQMPFHDISRTLGYRSDNSLYYTRNQVQDAYDELKRSNSELYRQWGPQWRKMEGVRRINSDSMIHKRRVISEGLARAEYREKLVALQTHERSRRKDFAKKMKAWPQDPWTHADDQELSWNALAERH